MPIIERRALIKPICELQTYIKYLEILSRPWDKNTADLIEYLNEVV